MTVKNGDRRTDTGGSNHQGWAGEEVACVLALQPLEFLNRFRCLNAQEFRRGHNVRLADRDSAAVLLPLPSQPR